MSALLARLGRDIGDLQMCQVILLCEDAGAYRNAMDHFRELSGEADAGSDFHFNTWFFQDLAETGATSGLVRTARAADIILVSLRSPLLPPLVSACLADAAKARHRGIGLLALMSDAHGGGLSLVADELEMIARTARMDFLMVQPVFYWTGNGDATRGRTLSSTRGGISEPACDHWGLNE